MPPQTKIIPPYPNAKYSFDTNVYISIWRYHYPPDMFSPIYEKIGELIRSGVIKSSYPVKKELQRQRDQISEYFTSFEDLFVEPTRKEQRYVTQLVNDFDNFPKWSHADSRKHYADPYVVALAKAYDLKIVTYESGTNLNSIGRACQILEIEVYSFSEFLREENFTLNQSDT